MTRLCVVTNEVSGTLYLHMLDDSEARLQHVAMAASGQLCAGLAYTEIQSFPIPSLTQASLSVSVTPHEAGGILDLTGLREMKLDPP